jgi:hypothetical protein
VEITKVAVYQHIVESGGITVRGKSFLHTKIAADLGWPKQEMLVKRYLEELVADGLIEVVKKTAWAIKNVDPALLEAAFGPGWQNGHEPAEEAAEDRSDVSVAPVPSPAALAGRIPVRREPVVAEKMAAEARGIGRGSGTGLLGEVASGAINSLRRQVAG